MNSLYCIPPVYTIAVCDKVSATSIIEDYENRLTTYQNYKKINLNKIVSKDVMLNITEDKTRLCQIKKCVCVLNCLRNTSRLSIIQ